jgi:hypothetical protein
MTNSSEEKPNGTNGSGRVSWWRFRRLAINWPLFLWVGLAVLCVFLYIRTIQYGIVTAAAQAIQQEVAPLETARVKSDLRAAWKSCDARAGIGAVGHDTDR